MVVAPARGDKVFTGWYKKVSPDIKMYLFLCSH